MKTCIVKSKILINSFSTNGRNYYKHSWKKDLPFGMHLLRQNLCRRLHCLSVSVLQLAATKTTNVTIKSFITVQESEFRCFQEASIGKSV